MAPAPRNGTGGASTPRRVPGRPSGHPRTAPARRGARRLRAPFAALSGLLRDFPWRRWMAVLICVGVLLIGVPLAHALVGDLGALLLLTGLGGFALGRATARRPSPPARKPRGRA